MSGNKEFINILLVRLNAIKNKQNEIALKQILILTLGVILCLTAETAGQRNKRLRKQRERNCARHTCQATSHRQATL